MKAVKNMSGEEVAALVCDTLNAYGITVTLTGGGCVAIWSHGAYVSRDLDFIEEGPVPRRRIKAALHDIGFTEKRRYFTHPDTEFFVEFPSGPLTVGDERVRKVETRDSETGRLRLLSPTDCVKDRLAAWFYWKDREAFEQAVLVARNQPIDVKDLARWSSAEGQGSLFAEFKERLRTLG